MQGIKLCYEKKASVPFRISVHPFLLYTIEEVCYYLLTNLYTLEQSFQEDGFFRWLEEELNLKKLAEELRLKEGTTQEYAEHILAYMDYCNQQEWVEVKNCIEELKYLTPGEYRCIRADNYLRNGQYQSAILEYRRLLRQNNEKENEKVWNNIGVAYAKMFLFQEASNYFWQAYELNQSYEILKNYLFSCYFLYSEEKYQQLLIKHAITAENRNQIMQQIKDFLSKAQGSAYRRQIKLLSRYKKEGNFSAYHSGLDKIIHNWKQNYMQEAE